MLGISDYFLLPVKIVESQKIESWLIPRPLREGRHRTLNVEDHTYSTFQSTPLREGDFSVCASAIDMKGFQSTPCVGRRRWDKIRFG